MKYKSILKKITIAFSIGFFFLSGCKNNSNQSPYVESSSVSDSIFDSTSAPISDLSNSVSSLSESSILSQESSSETKSSEIETFDKNTSSEIDTTLSIPPEQLVLYTAYQNVLTDLLEHSILPDGKTAKTKADYFIIQDVDEDYTEELILAWSSSSSFGNIFHVYQYDAESDSFHVKWNKSSSVKLYDKGTITVPVPVNYGLSSTDQFYPYGFYQYNKEKGVYIFQAYVDAWQKSFLSSDYDGNSYPSNIDTENVGMVYSISYVNEGDDYVNDYTYSQSQYDLFCDENFGTQISIDEMMELSDKNIQSILEQ